MKSILKWAVILAAMYALMLAVFVYGTSKDVWNAGNSSYVPEGK